MKNRALMIKDVKLASNITLAPMAGFSDLGFRSLCSKYGAGLVCTEMVSAKALSYKNEKTEDLLKCTKTKSKVAVQIFGHEPKVMAEAVQNPLLERFDIIDINMGCPAPKIVKNGDGSALLNNINLAKEIISECVKVSKKPITVKFRIGFEMDNNIAVEFAKMCEQAGASAITVHGRYSKQGYSGRTNYDAIAQVKKAVSIPVFANGDIKGIEDAERVLKLTGADGIMIGRAALGKPEIFKELNLKKDIRLSKKQKLGQILYHYKIMLKYFSEKFVVLNLRAHLANYLKGEFKNSELLVNLLKLETYKDISQFLRKNFK